MGRKINDIFISRPGVVCAQSASTQEFMRNISAQKCMLSKRVVCGREFVFGGCDFALPEIASAHFNTRTNQLALAAAQQINEQINEAIVRYGADQIAVVIGTTVIGVDENFAAFSPSGEINAGKFLAARHEFSHPAQFLREHFGLRNLALGVSSACTSGAKAIAQAAILIRSGVCKAVIAGGADSLSALTLMGFASLGILSDEFCLPLSANRAGANLSEGAALFVLSARDFSGVRLSAYASNNDAFHATKPLPDGALAAQMISKTLQICQQADYVNLHATATLANDASEALALHKSAPSLPASGIKGQIGHALGAAGAIELAYCVEAIAAQLPIAPHYYDGIIDESLAEITLLKEPLLIKSALSLSFAFGGDNAALAVSAC